MKAKELEDLAEAVRTENHRLYALQEQRKYGAPFIHSHRSVSHPRSFNSGNVALVQDPPEEFLQLNIKGIDWERITSAVRFSSSFQFRKVMSNDTTSFLR